MSKLYPVGVQNFEKVILGGYEYVDKTALIYQLFNTGCYYFLSRPRRFGKSLLLSTIESYAQGKKELFKGLALEQLEKEWTVYPVLHLDLNTQKYDTPESLTNVLEENVQNWEALYGASPSEIGVARRFQGIIRRACEQTGRQVVILIDEYDKPMLQAIGNETLQNEYRSTLKAFYGALKSMDGCIRFALLTGVTKFGKVSVFSDLNNLMGISMDDRYAEICGISDKEIHACFEEDINALATATDMSYEEACEELKINYDGYHFTENSVGLYNPFSLLNTFKGYNKMFENYTLGFPNREVHYQNILYIIFKLMGFYVQVEYRTSRGRIDLVLQTKKYVYIMEFKLNGSADEALAQIREKGYAEPFAKDGRTIYKIGVNFSDEIRNIQEVKVE